MADKFDWVDAHYALKITFHTITIPPFLCLTFGKGVAEKIGAIFGVTSLEAGLGGLLALSVLGYFAGKGVAWLLTRDESPTTLFLRKLWKGYVKVFIAALVAMIISLFLSIFYTVTFAKECDPVQTAGKAIHAPCFTKRG